MKTANFIREHGACKQGAKWALSISDEMSAVWDALVEQKRLDWLLWTATRVGVFPDSALRRLACRFVRETPVSDDSTVWDLLKDERYRKAVEVAEAYVDGNATEAELAAAYAAARAAARAADAARVASGAGDAARAAARAAAYATGISGYAGYAGYTTRSDTCFVYAAAYAADAAGYAVDDAACAAAYAAAYDAQIKMVAELGNPFQKGASK